MRVLCSHLGFDQAAPSFRCPGVKQPGTLHLCREIVATSLFLPYSSPEVLQLLKHHETRQKVERGTEWRATFFQMSLSWQLWFPNQVDSWVQMLLFNLAATYSEEMRELSLSREGRKHRIPCKRIERPRLPKEQLDPPSSLWIDTNVSTWCSGKTARGWVKTKASHRDRKRRREEDVTRGSRQGHVSGIKVTTFPSIHFHCEWDKSYHPFPYISCIE